MVASGLPVAAKNRTRHATEVASMSLEIMSTVSEATVPHLPQEKWKVRIGINSGKNNHDNNNINNYNNHDDNNNNIRLLHGIFPIACIISPRFNISLRTAWLEG